MNELVELPAGPSLQRILVAYALFYVAYFSGYGLMVPYAPEWFSSLGCSSIAIGIFISIQNWTRIIGPYGWSWLSDHGVSYAKLLRIASFVIALASLGLLVYHTPIAIGVLIFIIFWAVSGIYSLTDAAVTSLLTNKVGTLDVGRYGRIRLWGSIGFLATVAISGPILDHLGMHSFPFMYSISAAGMLGIAFIIPSQNKVVTHTEKQSKESVSNILSQPKVMWTFGCMFFNVAAHTLLYAFLSLYLKSLDYNQTEISHFWSLGVVAEVLFFALQGKWFERFQPSQWLVFVGIVCTLRFGGLSLLNQGHWPIIIGLLQILHAFTFGAQHSACMSLIRNFFPNKIFGRGMALYSVVGYGMGGSLFGILGGFICEHFGLVSVFYTATLVSIASAICAFQAHRYSRSPRLTYTS